MNYPEFNSLSIISLLISAVGLAIVYFFVVKISARTLRLEKKVVDIIHNLTELHSKMSGINKKASNKNKINYMEGDIDLVAENKKATFKAIYYPKKIQNSED